MVEIVPGVHWIEGINCNVYLIADKDLTLIDTGLPKKAPKILAYIKHVLKRQPSELKLIIITHGHVDHTGSVTALKAATGAKVACHAEEADFLAGRKSLPPPTGGIKYLFKLLRPFLKADPFEVDQTFIEGDTIAGLKVVHVPGHTPGSVALLDEARKVLFSGDAVRYRKGKVEGPPKAFTPDPQRALQSLERLKVLDFDIMLGGHGEPLRPGASAKIKETKFTV